MGKPTRIDRVINAAFPGWGVRRAKARIWGEALSGFDVNKGNRTRRPEAGATYGGGTSTRLDNTWGTSESTMGFNTIDRQAVASMRDRARNVDQNSAVGNGILNRLVDNVIGEGMTLQANTTSKPFNAEAELRWFAWQDQMDLRGMMLGSEFDRNAYRAHERDGDVGIILVDDAGKSRLQMIPGDQIATPSGASSNRKIVEGVEVNRVGRPIRFYVNGTTIAAKDFVFYPRMRRGATQIRGETTFAQVFPLLDQLDGYTDAVVVAARMAAVFGLIFKENNAAKNFAGLPNLTNSDGDSQKAITLENGLVKYIGQDDDVVQVQASQPMSQTPDFMRAILRNIGLPMDMPLELLLLDYSQVNFSSARAALLNFYRAMKSRQANYKTVVKSRIYRWWISREVKAGAFVSEVPEEFMTHDFQATRWQWVDPVKELTALLMEIDMGINTRRNIASSVGRDYGTMSAENKKELKALRKAELPVVRSNMTRDEGAQDGQDESGNETAPPPQTDTETEAQPDDSDDGANDDE